MSTLFRRKTIASTLRDIEASGDAGHGTGLHRTLTTRDLTAFGIAAIIGGGIFTAVGNASFDGGPAIIFLYVFTALACGLAAYCYAEFASTVPISGSAYTYAYVAFGDHSLDHRLGPAHGICHRKNIVAAYFWSGLFSAIFWRALAGMCRLFLPWIIRVLIGLF
ncbi:MAG: amino acid permease [Chitinophagales bacterium]